MDLPGENNLSVVDVDGSPHLRFIDPHNIIPLELETTRVRKAKAVVNAPVITPLPLFRNVSSRASVMESFKQIQSNIRHSMRDNRALQGNYGCSF